MTVSIVSGALRSTKHSLYILSAMDPGQRLAHSLAIRMKQLPTISLVITVLELCGSILSLIGSGLVLLCYLILPLQRHFRHMLILNLMVADFFYSLNHGVGDAIILVRKADLGAGVGCTLQGLVSQITVQAVDCAVLAITICTVFTITRRNPVSPVCGERQYSWILILLSIWAMPIFTGFLSLGMNWYGPASDDHCWIKLSPTYLRYVLTHGWRFAFIAVEICLYIYLHFWLRRHYRNMAEMGIHNSQPQSFHQTSSSLRFQTNQNTTKGDPDIEIMSSSGLFPEPISGDMARRESLASPAYARYHAVRKALLLHAYPLAYIILWIPGLANRLVEATGRTSRVTEAMQASTQLIGLANALTYGWNEQLAGKLRVRLQRFSLRDTVSLSRVEHIRARNAEAPMEM